MKELFGKYLKGDPVIWFVVLALSVIGVMAVYSSTGTLAYKDRGGDTEYYLIKHVSLLGFGLGTMWLTHLINIQYYSRIGQIMLYLAVPLLIYTLFFGLEINEARRWVSIPGGLTVQSSDFAKLALIVFVARFMAKRQGEVHDFKKTLLPILGWILLVCVLIFPEDFSTSAVLFLTSMLVLFLGRIPMKQIGLLLGIGILVY